jgi:hypothetical protein
MRRAYLQNVTYGVSIYVDAFRISKQFWFWSHLPWPSLASSSLSKSYIGSAWQRSYALEDGRSMAPQRPLNRAHFQAFVDANQAPPTFLLHFRQRVPLSKFYATLFRFSTSSVLSSVTQATFSCGFQPFSKQPTNKDQGPFSQLRPCCLLQRP